MCEENNKLEHWVKSQLEINKLYVHDFKNPISALSANLSFLNVVIEDADEDTRSALSDSMIASKMLLYMIDNLLLNSRLEAKESVEPSVISLNEFVRSSVKRCCELFPISESSVKIDENISDQLCEWPIPYVKSAFENLVLSSLHNSIAVSEISVGATEDGNLVKLTVRDHGVPIDESYYNKLFSRDFQKQSKSFQGTRYGRALGLYNVGLVADFLNGKISVSENENQYEFVLELPMLTP